MVNVDYIIKIKSIVSKAIAAAYDVEVESVKILELDVSREGAVVVKGEWESTYGKGRFEARVDGEDILYFKIEV